jgi:replicative DNA helicase
MATTEAEALPASLDAERTILGAVMLETDRILDIAAILKPDDFFLDSHRRICAAMIAVNEQGRSIDLITLSAELDRTHALEAVGGRAYLCGLTEGLPRRPVIENYIEIVKNKAMRRALIAVSSHLSARAYSMDQSSLESASWVISAVSDVVEKEQTKNEIREMAELCDELEYSLLDHPTETTALPTSIQSLDDFTGGGIRRGELWVIGASPARGCASLQKSMTLRPFFSHRVRDQTDGQSTPNQLCFRSKNQGRWKKRRIRSYFPTGLSTPRTAASLPARMN